MWDLFCSSVSGIAKRLGRMNEETIFSHWNIYNISRYNMGCPFNIIYIYTEWALLLSLSLCFEIGDFYVRIKQKTLSYMCLTISLARHSQRYVFFFTMQRSIKNIISPKVNIFSAWWIILMQKSKKTAVFNKHIIIHCTHYTNHLIACVSIMFWCNVCNGDCNLIAPNGYWLSVC